MYLEKMNWDFFKHSCTTDHSKPTPDEAEAASTILLVTHITMHLTPDIPAASLLKQRDFLLARLDGSAGGFWLTPC